MRHRPDIQAAEARLQAATARTGVAVADLYPRVTLGLSLGVESLDAGKGIRPLIERLTPAGKPRPSDEELKFVNQMVMTMNDPKALAACVRGLRGLAATEEQLRANKVPALALIGADDPLKAGVDELAGVMANLQVAVLEGDHMTAFRNIQFVNDLKGFLADHSAAPAAAAAAGGK